MVFAYPIHTTRVIGKCILLVIDKPPHPHPHPLHRNSSCHLRQEPAEAVGGEFAVVDHLVLYPVVGKRDDGRQIAERFRVLVRPGRVGAGFGVIDAHLCWCVLAEGTCGWRFVV